jgi:putative hydrolase of the HAD superfamily
MRRKYRHLFFDLDRTLWDYDQNSSEALSEIYQSYGLQAIFDSFGNFHKTFIRLNNELWKEYRDGKIHKDLVRHLRFEKTLMEFGTSDPDLAKKLNNDFLEISPRKPHLVDGAIELLEMLQKERYGLYIITNGFTEIQLLKMETTGLTGYFHKIFTSENTRSNKPHRAIFEHAVTSVNAKKVESLMIGDDLEADIAGARNFGIDQVYFNPEKIPHSENSTKEVPYVQNLKLVTYEITELNQLYRILKPSFL